MVNKFIVAAIFANALGIPIIAINDRMEEKIFMEDEITFFETEGYIKVSGLLDDKLVEKLADAAQQTIQSSPPFPFFYSVSQTGLLFGNTQEGKYNHTTTTAFRDTALYSKLPQAAAELMKLDPQSHNVRVLRDVFLAKSVKEEESCDWHVDDLGFWPESYISQNGIEGVNVWIALDDMPSDYQGSMAVAPRSHTAEWRHRAYAALGQDRSQDGGKSKEEVILKIQRQKESDRPKSKYPTCDMAMEDPGIREIVDQQKLILDYKRGDVIFATRLLFHRSLPTTREGLDYFYEIGKEHLSRYSIRYVPGSAKLPDGWSVEWSILENAENAGESLDIVSEHSSGLFYPQVWPKLDQWSLNSGLDDMALMLPELAAKAQSEFMSTIFGNPSKDS